MQLGEAFYWENRLASTEKVLRLWKDLFLYILLSPVETKLDTQFFIYIRLISHLYILLLFTRYTIVYAGERIRSYGRQSEIASVYREKKCNFSRALILI